jgi:hypothetical protein
VVCGTYVLIVRRYYQGLQHICKTLSVVLIWHSSCSSGGLPSAGGSCSPNKITIMVVGCRSGLLGPGKQSIWVRRMGMQLKVCHLDATPS